MKEGTYQHDAWHLKEALNDVSCCDSITAAVCARSVAETKHFPNLETILKLPEPKP